jgi:hypothetical protein
MPRVGVVGALVWDEIHGRDPQAAPVTEWGGIAYALAGFDAALDPEWELVPLVKVGRDLAAPAERFVRSLKRVAPSSRLALVDAANNRVVLRYETSERRCERMSGGVPPWTWDELGPMVRDLDAIYINFISGFELCLGTATALRQAFDGPIYADLHSLMLGMGRDGLRARRPLPDAPSWYRCFNFIQMNEAEMHQLSPDPLQLAGHMLDAGASALLVTMGPRGAVYVAGGGPDSALVRSALVKAPAVEALDPTGCGDVFGATAFARLVAGAPLEAAIDAAVAAAARNATYRGASGLASHLRGSLVTP